MPRSTMPWLYSQAGSGAISAGFGQRASTASAKRQRQ
jgi:hypothetical protein